MILESLEDIYISDRSLVNLAHLILDKSAILIINWLHGLKYLLDLLDAWLINNAIINWSNSPNRGYWEHLWLVVDSSVHHVVNLHELGVHVSLIH